MGDIIVLTVLGLSALLAFARGFVSEVLAISSWVAAAAAAFLLLDQATPIAAEYLGEGIIAQAAAGAAIFIVTLIIFSLVAGWIGKIVKATHLNAVDRSLGFLFGLGRGALLVCLAFLLFDLFGPERPDQPTWVTEAASYPWVVQGSEGLQTLLPEGFLDDEPPEAGSFSLDRVQTPRPVESGDALPGYTDANRDGLDALTEDAAADLERRRVTSEPLDPVAPDR